MIIIVPDWDLLKFFGHFSFRISLISGKCIDWLLKIIEKAIEARKEELRRCCPGALVTNEPKFIWVAMFNRSNPQQLLAVCNKYNTALEELLANRCYHYFIDISKQMNDVKFFTPENNLTQRGKLNFWNEIDWLIEMFDYQKISLRPNLHAARKGKDTTKPMQAVAPSVPNNKNKYF